MSYDPEAAHAKLTAFVETLTETALRQTALDKMTADEQAVVRKTVERLGWAVDEIEKVIAEHPQSSVQHHALNELLGALSAAFLIGNRATRSPVVERIEREDKVASAAHASRKRAETSTLADGPITECVISLWNKAPKLRGKVKPTADKIYESGALSKLKLGPTALEKHIRALKKSGRLVSRP